MKIRTVLSVFLLGLISALAAERDHGGRGGLRSADPKGPELIRRNEEHDRGINNGNSNDTSSLGGDGSEGGNPQPELSGRIIIARKSTKKLQKEGKGPNEIAQMRAKGLNKIKRNKVVFQMGKEEDDDDFQVVEVGRGNEAAFINDFASGEDADIFDFIEPDYIEFPVGATPNDPLLRRQYHHRLMQSYDAWDFVRGSSDITIAICDTGLEPNHPDLEANRLPGYHAPSQTWEVDGGDVTNVHPHGTLCAGCAAAIGNNDEGVSGIGWNFKHRPGRVTDEPSGGANSFILADCVR